MTDPSRHEAVSAVLGEEAEAFRLVVRRLIDRGRRNRLRRRYYEGEEVARNIGIAVPEDLEALMPVVGWPAKAVNTVARRLRLRGFAVPGQGGLVTEVQDVLDANAWAVGARQVHTAALRDGVCFVAVTAGDASRGEPAAVLTPYTATDASGLWDQRRHCLEYALTVDERNEYGGVLGMSWWTAESRVEVTRDSTTAPWRAERLWHAFGRVPVVALAYAPTPGRPFGTSRITRPVMRLTDHAARTLLRLEVASEFFSAPQRYLLGADMEAFEDEAGELRPGWEAVIGHLLVASRPTRNETTGEVSEVNPVAGQFTQGSMEPHTGELRAVATMFASETSIPLNYLGIVQDNPASADAIKAAEADLVSVAEDAQNDFTDAWAQVAALAVQAARGTTVVPDDMAGLRPVWHDPSTPTRASQAQSVMELVSAGVLPATSEVTYELLGFDRPTVSRLMVEAAQARTTSLVQSLAEGAAQVSTTARDIVEDRGTDAEAVTSTTGGEE
ncbi:phage portal protein [Actinomyces lilanjuaniae]|uniref:Phage portal protein n=1 Tax=Actinomyces lilanjuaniae TaxID=2321394 RepID=A0ABM6Z3F1_9ACTO|nr:phage portal protein [Actinomyces lilanjuaniae]AYD89678.1 phage portal protein [Actinomyces lilanjuaniae]